MADKIVEMAKLFSFPNPVNDYAARTVASGVVAMTVTTLATRQLWLTIPLAYGFLARVLTGPKLSPLGQLATRVVAPRLSATPRLVAGPPKRFAQSIGLLFSSSALALWLVGHAVAALVILTALTVPACLEAAFGFCVGCQLFALAMHLGLIPRSVCTECDDIWNRRPTLDAPRA